MCFGCSTSIRHMREYLNLMENALDFKKFFEEDIHPNSLNKFNIRITTIVDHLGSLILDCVGMPKDKKYLRNFYMDCILEHFTKRHISRKHLEEMLINWKDDDIMKQAE